MSSLQIKLKTMAQDKMVRLKELIAIELDSCNKTDWPYVCHMAADTNTRKEIEAMIIEQVQASGIGVGQALERIERAYNPNKMED
jgi:predicted metal-binding protein